MIDNLKGIPGYRKVEKRPRAVEAPYPRKIGSEGKLVPDPNNR
jgi:hypothetical protein